MSQKKKRSNKKLKTAAAGIAGGTAIAGGVALGDTLKEQSSKSTPGSVDKNQNGPATDAKTASNLPNQKKTAGSSETSNSSEKTNDTKTPEVINPTDILSQIEQSINQFLTNIQNI